MAVPNLVVELQERDFDAVFLATGLQRVKNVPHAAWNDAGHLVVGRQVAQHRVRLARAGLAVGKHGAVVPGKRFVDRGLDARLEHVFLGRILAKHLVERKRLALHDGDFVRVGLAVHDRRSPQGFLAVVERPAPHGNLDVVLHLCSTNAHVV